MSENKKIIAAPSVTKDATEKLLRKMYISNVAKRLRELNAPNDIDRKRWVWELIQNAKDTIVGDSSRKDINIRIEIDGDTVKFKHDGNPFTADARFGLLYKYSEDKENQESTGRFGTGFLTTHCLSKIVSIESNMYRNEERTQLCGFSVTMYRDGQIENELLEGLNKMTQSEVYYEETFDWTTFTYHVTTESGKRAVKLGIENFHENIAQTMLFCKEIASIELNDNGVITRISRKQIVEVAPNIMLAEFDFLGIEPHTRRFLFTSFSEYNKELSERYRAPRNIRIDAAIEIDSNNNVVNHNGKTSHFCVLPLVGIENQFEEPIIINSPDFEPDSERQSLLLIGQSWNEENGNITETGINQIIYSNIFPLYSKLVSYLSENQYGKLYFLANGLKKAKDHDKLDGKWYLENVINKYRETLLKYPVVKAHIDNNYKFLSDCIIVKENKSEDEAIVYNLLTTLYPNKLIQENQNWAQVVWKEDIEVWNTEDLCKNIQEQKTWDALVLMGTDLPKWYNEFLAHVNTYDERFFKEYALLPNRNGTLLKKDTEGFKQGENITTFIIDLLFKLGKDVKPLLLHGDISAISLDSKYNSQSYSADINKLAKTIIEDNSKLDKIERLLPLISIVPNSGDKYEEDFLKHRSDFFDICKSLYSLNEASFVCENSLLEGAWKNTDEWLTTTILNSLQKLGCLSNLPNGLDATWINSTIKALHVQTERLNTYAVLPNQNGEFCCQKDLYKDSNVPEELKDNIFETIGINYKNILLHEDINAEDFAIVQKKTISSFAAELNDAITEKSHYSWGNYFNNNYHKYPKDIIYRIATYMVRLLPLNKETNLYKYQSSLLSVAQAFSITEEPIGYIDFDNDSLWEKISFYAACIIWEKIEEFSTLTDLCAYVNKGEIEVIKLLNSYYAYQDYADINFASDKVIPNQNGNLRSKDELYKEESAIDNTLKNIINQISIIDKEVQDYRELLVDKRINLSFNRVLCEKDAFNLIDESIDKLYQSTTLWEDESFITASQMLIEDWGEAHNGLFEENFPRVYPIKEKILMNVVWKKEKRELMMTVSTKLTEEQLRVIIENGSEISELSSKVATLEKENEYLRNKLAAMEVLPMSNLEQEPAVLEIISEAGERKMITIAEPQYAGLSTEEMKGILLDAKTDVRLFLEKKGYVFTKGICEDAWCNIYGVMNPEGQEVPIVVHSYKSRKRPFSLNTSDWEQLSKDGSMLWVVTDDGPQCVPFYALPNDTNTIAITFSSENMQYKNRCTALAETLKYFKGLHFNFGTSIGYNKTPEPFNNPSNEFKSLMRDMHNLPVQSTEVATIGAAEDSLL